MRIVLAVTAVLSLSACMQTDLVDDVSRRAAKSVVNPILAQRLPGVPTEPMTDCVIDNATSGEILTLARAAAIGIQPDTYDTVLGIAKRPETIQCIATNGLAPFLTL